MTAERVLPTFVGIRRQAGAVVHVERYDAMPWLQDLAEGIVAGTVMGCPTCQSICQVHSPLQVDDDGLVWCGLCGDLWPLTVTATVDLSGAEPIVLAGWLPGWPHDEPCRLCGCTNDRACAGGCWWKASTSGPVHDVGTPDGRSHAIRQDMAAWSQRTGQPVRALCGVRYVPDRLADPGDPPCERCDALLAQLGAT